MPSVLAESTDLRDYVQVYQNLLSPETCERIIDWAEQQPDADGAWDGWETAKSAVSETDNVITKFRTCHLTMMNEHRGVCVDRVEQAIRHIIETYPYFHGARGHTGLQVIRYQKGHKFEEHIDHYRGGPRILSLSIMLNHEYTGGELSFWNDKHKFRYLCAGDGVVFPSNLCFSHQVKPVIEGVRYALVTWLV
jgi:predicted 2-oxoglutarate/Fe(II)-dependent dioxygenase YbiX